MNRAFSYHIPIGQLITDLVISYYWTTNEGLVSIYKDQEKGAKINPFNDLASISTGCDLEMSRSARCVFDQMVAPTTFDSLTMRLSRGAEKSFICFCFYSTLEVK